MYKIYTRTLLIIFIYNVYIFIFYLFSRYQTKIVSYPKISRQIKKSLHYGKKDKIHTRNACSHC
jgi:hypothetical protein